ncbi:MAG TPA: hypothetical protein VG318_10215 [Actinomycetota bacterium]|nr:hypothetical protein [Actinomycetota bacterium]
MSGNNPDSTPGGPGRNSIVHGEIGPTDANGYVTFGVSMTRGDSGRVDLLVWLDLSGDDDVHEAGEPSATAENSWIPIETWLAKSLDATPETSTGENGTVHTVTVRLTADSNPMVGYTPSSMFVADASQRSEFDVANRNAGPSPNYVPGAANDHVYSCTPTNSQGISTCTFQDPLGTGPGTDTITFWFDQGGAVGQPNPDEPQDTVQRTWTGPAATPTPTPTPTPPPTATPTPTPPPVASPEPRHIRLCHEDAGVTVPCDVAPRATAADLKHVVAVLVTDREGAPLTNVPVELRESGPALFDASGASTVVAYTASDGVARATLRATGPGTSDVVAEISPPGMAGSLRGPGASDDECEQPGGRCLSETLTVTWTAPPPHEPVERHLRNVTMRFTHDDDGLVLYGKLRLPDDDYEGCTAGQPVELKRRVRGRWKTLRTAVTNGRGSYAVSVPDRLGLYRAVATRTERFVEDEALHVCRRIDKAKRHRHHG